MMHAYIFINISASTWSFETRLETGAPADAGDADAAWTKRGRSKRYGCKVHIGMDQTSCIVREAALTAANINESDVAEGLVSGDEGAVYGDRACYSRERSRRLRSRGVKDRIMKRASNAQSGAEASGEDAQPSDIQVACAC